MHPLVANIQERFLDGVDYSRELLKKWLDDFRHSTRYFKMKTYVLAGYVVTVLFTWIIFVPPGQLNEIAAEVKKTKTFMSGDCFAVTNKSSDDWRDVVVKVNHVYVQAASKLAAGKKKSFCLKEFKDAQGSPPEPKLRVRSIRIDCSEGAFECDLQKNPECTD